MLTDGMTMLRTAELIAANRASARPIAPYSRRATLAKLDQRTREARLLREARAELVRHVGGNPSAVQLALIDQAAQLRLRLACMDRKFAEDGTFTEHDSRTYLAWSNSYTRALRTLGLKGTAERPPSLAEHLAAAAAARARAAADTRSDAQHPPARTPASGPHDGPTGHVETQPT
jgi:hypothetical protein